MIHTCPWMSPGCWDKLVSDGALTVGLALVGLWDESGDLGVNMSMEG